VLPLQRTEIVSESRIAQIIERARKIAEDNSAERQGHLFANLEKTLRESDKGKRVEFYTHEEGWKNKLICGDSLHVMESLLHYENLRAKVQMIYIDPPYGIKYDSNFQQRVDSTENDDQDHADDVLTIKAFRDTWTLGIHSYLSYMEARLYLCRELLSETGSVFVQINDQNVHRVRLLMDEVFGASAFLGLIAFTKTTGLVARRGLAGRVDYLIWYARNIDAAIQHPLYEGQDPIESGYGHLELRDGTLRALTADEREKRIALPQGSRVVKLGDLTKPGPGAKYEIELGGKVFRPGRRWWGMPKEAMQRLIERGRVVALGTTLGQVRYHDDFPMKIVNNLWLGFSGAQRPDYVVQTNPGVVARCIHLTTRPGDIVFDPTCGSGTTAFVSEQFGRRWITCDTSRVAINVARQRLLREVYLHYRLRGDALSDGFVLRTIDRITARSVAYDMEPERIELVDQPEVDKDALRVCGPFEVMTLGRYSVEDWKGYVVHEPGIGEAAKLENYIEVICRLYRKDAAIQGATGLVHAVAEDEKEKIAISIGPLSGRVTAKQINDAVQDALGSGMLEVHVLGWAFEANVGEVKSALEKGGKVKVELIMIRPDTLAEGLKATQPEMLFSPLALPDVDIKVERNGKGKQLRIALKGVALFDRKRRTTEYKAADSGYVSAWYLDEDYDGDCFVDCQMFFDFKKAPNIKAALRAEVDPEEFTLKLTSEPFPVRGYKRVAVKVVDVYGNESVVVRDLA
jgi:adenine-specific DNA-methyltransferase